MAKKNKNDILDMVTSFKKQVLEKKPPFNELYDEVRMMRFKIKPLQGDISLLNLRNNEFIEILWSLGKLDEFFQNHMKSLTPKQREIFFRLFQEIYQKFQEELNRVNLKQEKVSEDPNAFEMEIFKDSVAKSN